MTSKSQTAGKILGGISAMPILILLTAGSALTAQTETVLRNFPGLSSGQTTNSGLVADAAGNLYGTSTFSGPFGLGTLFELSPPAAGQTAWSYKTLHNFGVFPTDGQFPNSPSLIFDAAGNLYGTTAFGGRDDGGTVFELSPQPDGTWKEKILRGFNNTVTGPFNPTSVIFDAAGNLYCTSNGGFYGNGAIFELSPNPAGGVWTVKMLHSFPSFPTDGFEPNGGLVIDAAGNLYGTTFMGGNRTASNVRGTVFELSPPAVAGGKWTETILHDFGVGPGDPSDGWDPLAGLVRDAAGNLYGTTFNGGTFDSNNTGGTVFEVSPVPGGGWTETVLHNFSQNHVDGFWPTAGVTLDAAGNLYGTASAGGANVDSPTYVLGVVFELSPPAPGGTTWTETILHPFGAGKDGTNPGSNVIFDGAGNLYGTTNNGGTRQNGGVVWQVTP